MSTVAIVVVAPGSSTGAEQALVRAQLEHLRGNVTSTPDGGFRGVFESVGAAVEAATEIQRSLSSGESSGASVGIDIGELDDQDDRVFEVAFETANGLAGLAEPGQIVITSVVRGLLVRRAGFTLGPFSLPDDIDPSATVTGADELFMVDWTPPRSTSNTRVIVADDAALIRSGIVQLLTTAAFSVIAEAGDAEELIAAVGSDPPDLVITDIRMPPTHTDEGLRAAATIRSEHPDVAVLVLSQHVEARLAAELLDGRPAGIGYLLKERVSDLAEFVEACTAVAGGGSVIDPLVAERLMRRRADDAVMSRLTDRERDVLGAMARGLSNQAIADELYLGKKTIETHVGSILQKLDLGESAEGNRRVQAVLQFLNSAL